MSRYLQAVAAALVLGATLSSSLLSPAPASARPATAAPDQDSTQATNAGTVTGTVTKVDYQKGHIMVQAAHGADVNVTVLPSTTIQGKAGFSELSDIVKGQRVVIFLSQKGDEKFAQIIQLQH